MESYFQVATTYWRDFHSTPDGKDLLKSLPSADHYRRAFEIFVFGFVGRMLLVPPTVTHRSAS